ncbi:MAG: plastocyanin/azurin family copper-binding protein, partial [Gaiellaceae bacterium]
MTRVTVAASEFKFVFSKRSAPIGTVAFTVVNRGKISHNFKIGGKVTPTLNPGQKATLTVIFKKKGRYAYLCTIPGHAAAGMKGLFAVATAPVAPPPVTSTSATTTTTAPPPPTGTIGSASTTVQVGMFEYHFDLSQTTVPSGQVTFVITNKGNEVHN